MMQLIDIPLNSAMKKRQAGLQLHISKARRHEAQPLRDCIKQLRQHTSHHISF